MKRMLTLALAAATLSLAACAPEAGEPDVPAEAASPEPARSGYVKANGVAYYYEVHGQGEPFLLLHGGLGSIDMFRPLLPVFSQHRQVVAVDLHGHGRTELGDRKIDPVDIAEDISHLLGELGYGQIDVFGYSFGGAVALRLAIQHPEQVRRLALVSAGFAQDGFYPEMLPMQAAVGAAMADQMTGTPMYDSYMAVAPHPQDFPRLLDGMGEWMRTPYDWSDEVKTLRGPVMLVYGDSDMFRPEHEIEFYHLLGGGLKDAGWMRENMSQNRLAVLPDLTHYEMFMSPALPAAVLPFLDGKSGVQSWAELVQASR